jgi:uncharacterized delta-60 repeat protein
MWNFFLPRPLKPRASRARRRCVRPQLEVLEERWCPSGGQLQWDDPDVIGEADSVYRVLAQPSGKIVLVGTGNDSKVIPHFTLAELDSNGGLDPNFGSGGIVVTPKGSISPYYAIDAVLYPTGSSGDEKILAAGYGSTDFALVRYNADGSVDTSFGNNGYVGTNLKQGRSAYDGVVLVPNGNSLPKIVMACSSADGSGVELARYNPNGSLDTTFGSKGTTYVAITGGIGVSALALDPVSGDLLVTGLGGQLAAFKSNGTLDSSFGQNGLISTGIANLYGLAVYPATDGAGNAGNILASGSGGVARYRVNGTLDTSWGGTGIVPAPGGSELFGMAIQPDDKIVVGMSNWSVARFNTDGSLDGSFGSGGVASSGIRNVLPENKSVTLLPNGDIVEAGTAFLRSAHTNAAFAAALYLPSEPEIGSFTANPTPIPSGAVTTLTASNLTDGNAGATVTQVAFYVVINNTQTLLGYGTNSNGTWTYSFDTTGLAPGSYTLDAQATDSYGVLGDALALTLTVQ